MRIDYARVKNMIADVFAAPGLRSTVKSRAPVEVGGIDAHAMISVPVESLKPVESSGDSQSLAPRKPSIRKASTAPSTNASGPKKGPRPIGTDGSYPIERLAVTKVGVEPEIGFAVMTQTYGPPWHSSLTLNLLIDLLAAKQPVGLIVGIRFPISRISKFAQLRSYSSLYSPNDAMSAHPLKTTQYRRVVCLVSCLGIFAASKAL